MRLEDIAWRVQNQMADHLEKQLEAELLTEDSMADAFFAGMVIERHINNEFFDTRITFTQTIEFFFDNGPWSEEDGLYQKEIG